MRLRVWFRLFIIVRTYLFGYILSKYIIMYLIQKFQQTMEYKRSYLQICTDNKKQNFKRYIIIMLPNSVKKSDFYWASFRR